MMRDPAALLVASRIVERALRVLVAVIVVVLAARAVRSRARSTRQTIAMPPSAERAVMLGVLAWVLATRLLGATAAQQPRWYFAQVSTLYTADALQAPDRFHRWVASLGNLQVIWEHESPIQEPVAAAVQHVLGPSIELPTFVGALWAIVGVVLAWRLGRTVETPAFGVVFAALVATSPLQTTWARLGGIYIGATAGVLFALWTGWVAGRRGGGVAAVLAGVVAWSCVYFYYSARVGMGLVFVALWAGWRRSRRGPARFVGLAVAAGAGLALFGSLQRAVGRGQSVWPAYRTYLGSPGQTSLGAWLASLWSRVHGQVGITLRDYFWHSRMPALVQQLHAIPSAWSGTTWEPGMMHGGLVLLPVAALGVIGLVRVLRRPLDHAIWLALVVCGLLPPLLGFPSARRFLVFDAGWCALAALGLLSLLESRLLDPATASARWRWAAGTLVALALWSIGAVGLSAAALPSHHVWIPFAESGFGDGSTCLACIQTAREWQREMENQRQVILFDTDLYRENATAPAGLVTYGKTAALAAGRPDLFLAYYAIASNRDTTPPRPGALAATVPEDMAAAIGARIEAAKPRAIVWWFTEPNAWERQLADTLVRAGSIRTELPPRPMWSADRQAASANPLRVETPWERREAALHALRDFVDPPVQRPCVRLEPVRSKSYEKCPLVLAPLRGAAGGTPQWAVASLESAEVWGTERSTPTALGFEYRTDGGATPTAELVDEFGTHHAWEPTGAEQPRNAAPGPRPLGRYCAALYGDGWWVVDPASGILHLPGSPPVSLALNAVGVTLLDGRAVIATADQQLHVFDPAERRYLSTFPAVVVPARLLKFGECAMLAAGRGWIASFDSLRGFLHFYAESGAPLGRVALPTVLGPTPSAVYAIRGAGDYLGVGHDTSVTTFRVVRDATCPAAPAVARN